MDGPDPGWGRMQSMHLRKAVLLIPANEHPRLAEVHSNCLTGRVWYQCPTLYAVWD